MLIGKCFAKFVSGHYPYKLNKPSLLTLMLLIVPFIIIFYLRLSSVVIHFVSEANMVKIRSHVKVKSLEKPDFYYYLILYVLVTTLRWRCGLNSTLTFNCEVTV